MSMPPDLTSAIQAAHVALSNDPHQHLELRYRQPILAALGPKMDASRTDGGPGYQRRTYLDLLTVKRVLPLWQAIWPSNTLPQQATAQAEKLLRGAPAQRDAAYQDIREYWGVFSDFNTEENPQDAKESMVLFAAIKALCRATYDMSFDPAQPPAEIKPGQFMLDGQVGPFNRDAAFDASVAAANGLPWDSTSSPQRRRAFWEWWLREAVPAAWESVPESGR